MGVGVAVGPGPGDGASVGAGLCDGKGCVATAGDDIIRVILKPFGLAAGPTGAGGCSDLRASGVARPPRTVGPSTCGSAGSLAAPCPAVRRKTPVAPIPIPLSKLPRTQSLWRRTLLAGTNSITAGSALSMVASSAGGP